MYTNRLTCGQLSRHVISFILLTQNGRIKLKKGADLINFYNIIDFHLSVDMETKL